MTTKKEYTWKDDVIGWSILFLVLCLISYNVYSGIKGNLDNHNLCNENMNTNYSYWDGGVYHYKGFNTTNYNCCKTITKYDNGYYKEEQCQGFELEQSKDE